VASEQDFRWGRLTTGIGFLILCLELGLLTAGGCSKVKAWYEVKVRTNFEQSADFSLFHTFAHSGMTDRGRKIAATDKYQEATLVVNLAESSRKKRVWQAVITETVGDHLEKNFEMINKGVAKAFKDYPPDK